MVSDIYNKPIVLITLYDEEKKISPSVGKKARMSVLTTHNQHCIGGPNQCNEIIKR